MDEAKAWPYLIKAGVKHIKSEGVLGPLLSLVEVFSSYGSRVRVRVRFAWWNSSPPAALSLSSHKTPQPHNPKPNLTLMSYPPRRLSSTVRVTWRSPTRH